jgi:hypothetical protein
MNEEEVIMTFRDTLPSGGRLNPNDDVVSNNGRFQLTMQSDGNLVLYDNARGRKVLWSSGTQGQAVNNCIMQSDGNLVIYGFPNPVWDSGTQGHPNAYLRVQDDGNMVIYPMGAALWTTNTVQS